MKRSKFLALAAASPAALIGGATETSKNPNGLEIVGGFPVEEFEMLMHLEDSPRRTDRDKFWEIMTTTPSKSYWYYMRKSIVKALNITGGVLPRWDSDLSNYGNPLASLSCGKNMGIIHNYAAISSSPEHFEIIDTIPISCVML